MFKEFITAAPSSVDTENIYSLWQETHTGNRRDFYRFMTTPTPERELFMASLDSDTSMEGGIATVMLKYNRI